MLSSLQRQQLTKPRIVQFVDSDFEAIEVSGPRVFGTVALPISTHVSCIPHA